MKNFILFLLLSISLFARTTYMSPAFVVEDKILYCTTFYGEQIIEKQIGDIITSEYAASYCAFNKEVAISKQQNQIKLYGKINKNKKEESSIASLIIVIIILSILSTFVLRNLFNEEKK